MYQFIPLVIISLYEMHRLCPPLIILLFSFAAFHGSYAAPVLKLDRGFHLSPEQGKDLLSSPDGTFTCGFNPVGTNAYSFSIWYANSADQTVVWTANRDSPVNGRGSRITLRRDGNLVLTDVDGSAVWDTNTSAVGVSTAQLLETGNLVLMDAAGNVVWESFRSPTDTLLPSQPLTKGKRLVSPVSEGALSTGYYVLYFDNDNVLRLMYDGPKISSIYWPNPDYTLFGNGRTNYNSSRVAVLDDNGQFSSSDHLQVRAGNYRDQSAKRRLSIDYDGGLRIYSLNSSSGRWTVVWEALPERCDVHGLCGENGICEYVMFGQAKCSCPPGYEMADQSDWNKGCKPKFNLKAVCHDLNGTATTDWSDFLELPYTDFYGFDMETYSTMVSFDTCRNACAQSCSCLGFGYRIVGNGLCFPKSFLFNGSKSQKFLGMFYLRLPKNMSSSSPAMDASTFTCSNNSDSEVQVGSAKMYGSNKGVNWFYLYMYALAMGALEFFFIIIGWWFIFARQETPKSLEEGYRMISSQFRKFTYGELKEATGKFKEELGRGGSGAVYRGVLDDKRVVAVKKLTNATQGEEEFWAEVSVIGRINHMNLVRMYGFCSEGSHRLLVCEYVENQSLDKYLFGRQDSGGTLGWNQRFKIALGTARGLAYLHHECLEWIIHCDVKPENILLDSEFEAKIADFGLAKLSKRDDAGFEFSRMRGTMGYLAPEWLLNLPISAKVDVYSYGVVLLEILKGARASSWATAGEQQKDVKQIVADLKDLVLAQDASKMKDVMDQRLNGQYDNMQAMAMVKAAISCLEESPSRRSTMSDVMKILMSTDQQDAHPADGW